MPSLNRDNETVKLSGFYTRGWKTYKIHAIYLHRIKGIAIIFGGNFQIEMHPLLFMKVKELYQVLGIRIILWCTFSKDQVI